MSNPYQTPGQIPGSNYPPSNVGRDSTGGVIPYNNPHALIGYYVGFVSLLFCFTPLPLGILAVVLGVMGLQRRARNPAIKGSAHAWIAIVLGVVGTLGSLSIGLVIAIGIVGGIMGGGR